MAWPSRSSLSRLDYGARRWAGRVISPQDAGKVGALWGHFSPADPHPCNLGGMTHDPISLALDFLAKILSALLAALLTRRLARPTTTQPLELPPAQPARKRRGKR